MKVDVIDNTLISEECEFETVLSFFKEKRKFPEYIELYILKIISEQIGIGTNEYFTAEEYLNNLPTCFIKREISSIDEMYGCKSKISYKDKYLSYLLYYLPANIFKIWKPLLDLQTKDLLKAELKILDIGTGPGSVPIGIIEYYKSLANCFNDILFTLNFTLIEKETEFLKIANKLINMIKNQLPANLNVLVEKCIIEDITEDSKYDSLGNFDMVIMSNFITNNEGKNQIYGYDIISNLKNHLLDDGSIIIIEPGDNENCRKLKLMRNEIINNNILDIYSPCIGIWENKTYYDCSCFSMVRSYWELPKIYKFLIKHGLSKGKRKDIPFNYIIYRKDHKKKYEIINNQQNFVKLADIKKYNEKKINVIAMIRTVIYDKHSDNVSIALCDGTCSCDNFNSVWIRVSNSLLIKSGFTIPLISAERIRLRGVEVKLNNNEINLGINPNTKIRIEY